MEPTKYGPDSYHYKGWIQYQGLDADKLFTVLRDCGFWQERYASHMTYRGSQLQRTKMFLVDDPQEPPQRLPKYTYPGFQYESMKYYHAVHCVPEIEELLHLLQRKCECKFNHIIGTHYTDETDNIGWHSDKTKDIKE